MPKIIGEKLQDYVVDQIKARQKAHGSGTDGNTRTLNQLTYLNSKTAWVKLASGVEITPERLGPSYENLRSGFAWQGLAKYAVLFGGTSRLEDKKLKPRGTFDDKNNIWDYYDGVYNVSATATTNSPTGDFGLVPMPGIVSAEVKCLNRGSIKKATVNVKCYSPEQFQIIDLLYLRIGYTMFLEWGNSLYLSNDDPDKLTRMGYTLTEADQGFFSSDSHKLSHLGFLPKIERYRDNKDGNYDGLLCKVTNFNWTFSQDGSYDINIELISLGDVVESLKLNIAPAYEIAKFIDEAYKIYSEDTSQNEEAAEINTPSPSDNWISAYLFLQKLSVDENYNSSGGYDANERFESDDVIAGKITSTGTTLELGGVFVKPPTELTIEVEDPLSITETVLAAAVPGVGTAVLLYDLIWGFTKPVTVNPTVAEDQEKKDVVHFAYNRGEDDEDQTIVDSEFYMRLGHLLQFISSYVIPVVEKDQDSPLLIIDYDQWGNKMYTLPYQVSLDPRVCVVNAAVEPVNSKEFFPNLVNWKYISSDQSEAYGWTMNIYVNHAQILSSLEDAKNDEGDVNVFEFLSSLCTAINKAMGGINNLEPIYDEDSHTISIIDGSYAPPSKPNYVLDLYGYNINDKNSSTFVRNFSLKTEITNDFATMATIGSTAGGYTKGVENTMFSKWNKGLIDPWKEKITPPKKSRDKGSDQEEPNKLYVSQFWNGRYSAWGYTLLDLAKDVGSDYAGMDDSIIEKNLTTVKNFFQYCQSKIQQEQEKYASPTNGFVPISLGLTMDGISGIKIYNEINVDTRFLPKNYSDNLRFIIKGVNHKLSNSDWETSIETVVISQSGDKNQPPLPYSKIKEIMDKEIALGVTALGATSGESSTTGGSPSSSTPKPNGSGVYSNPPLPNTVKSETGSTLEKYTKEAASEQFKAEGSNNGYCGAWTYKMAERLAKKLTGKSSFPGTGKGGNHAYSQTLRDHLNQLEIYKPDSLTPVATGLSPEQARDKINEITKKTDYGDVLVYFMTPPPKYSASSDARFHAQFYTGNLYTSLGGTGWSTSNYTNYQVNMVYRTGNPYTIYWFRIKDEYKGKASSSSSSPKSGKPDKEDSASGFNSLTYMLSLIYKLKDNYGTDGKPLFTPFIGNTDDTEGAIKALNKWFTTSKPQTQYKKLKDIQGSFYDKTAFDKYFKELKTETTETFSGKVTFRSENNDKVKQITIDSDFERR